MPTRPKRFCGQPAPRAATEKRRLTAHQRGYTKEWNRYAKGFLRAHPLCVACQAEGRVIPATQVDHIVPHRGDQVLFWDPKNHQGLCRSHHSRKTCLEDGGFGRPRKDRTP